MEVSVEPNFEFPWLSQANLYYLPRYLTNPKESHYISFLRSLVVWTCIPIHPVSPPNSQVLAQRQRVRGKLETLMLQELGNFQVTGPNSNVTSSRTGFIPEFMPTV